MDHAVGRHAGLEHAARVFDQRQLHREYQLDALFLGLDVLGREFGGGRHLGDGGGERLVRKRIHAHLRALAERHAADQRLRHVDLEVQAVQVHQREQRAARRHLLAQLHAARQHHAGEWAWDVEIADLRVEFGELCLGLLHLTFQRRERLCLRDEALVAELCQIKVLAGRLHRRDRRLGCLSRHVGAQARGFGLLFRGQLLRGQCGHAPRVGGRLAAIRLRGGKTRLRLVEGGPGLRDAQRQLAFGHRVGGALAGEPVLQGIELLQNGAAALAQRRLVEPRQTRAGAD